ncbi:MAG: tetratricopeptide repeat protein, partial [Gammaproteobacteria bacterium]|nr:tetratricopeptide repeat protein [Gammaproteobacteria bacterium]
MTFAPSLRADDLDEAALRSCEAGDEDSAILLYRQALEIDPRRANTHFNLGLIYKYRRAWRECFDHNARARALDPSDEATCWNLAIAATALHDWFTAREVWRDLNLISSPGNGPVVEDFGTAPVRLNANATADAAIEVVWARRICPARARIETIPKGETGFRYGDVVLHDGAATGYRLNSDGQERPVFNALELFEPSRFSTYEAWVEGDSMEDIEALDSLCKRASIPFE